MLRLIARLMGCHFKSLLLQICIYMALAGIRELHAPSPPSAAHALLIGWTVVIDRNCRAAFGEKSFVIPGNGHRTAIPRTAFRVFLTVVAALFQDWASTAMPSLQYAAFRAFVTVIPGTWTSTATATRWHSAFVTVVTTLFQEMDTHCRAHAAFRRLGYSNSKKWASSTTAPRPEFRENLFVTKDCCIPGNRHRLPCHAVHLD